MPLQNLIGRGFADFLAQYLSILKEFWAVNRCQILSPCGFAHFSARNNLKLIPDSPLEMGREVSGKVKRP